MKIAATFFFVFVCYYTLNAYDILEVTNFWVHFLFTMIGVVSFLTLTFIPHLKSVEKQRLDRMRREERVIKDHMCERCQKMMFDNNLSFKYQNWSPIKEDDENGNRTEDKN